MQAMQLRTPSILTAYINISMWLRDWLNSFGTRHCMAVLPDPFSIFPKGVWARDYVPSPNPNPNYNTKSKPLHHKQPCTQFYLMCIAHT